MNILGINCSFNAMNHDPSACLMVNGKIVGALEEERLNRIKTSLGYFPYKSINSILKNSKITIKDIDLVVSTGSTHKDIQKKIKSCLIHAYGYSPKIKIFNHALTHIAGTFFSSGFNESLIVSIDGMGDKISTMICEGNNNKINEIYRSTGKEQFESLGVFYACFTEYLGFKQTEGEYKVMGMSAYGKKIFNLDRFIKVRKKPFRIELNPNIMVKWKVNSAFQPVVNYDYLKKFFPPRNSEKEKFKQVHFDLAKSVQSKYEEILIEIIKKFKGDYKNLCLAGGCGLNCLANSKLNKLFEKIYVMPASSDRGLPIGSVYLANYLLKNKNHKVQNMFLGNNYTDREILKILKQSNIKYKKCNPNLDAAKEIIDGKIVGWFKGRSEFGPRALGARSILARADLKGMKKKINSRIKFREKFRPFAPAILYSYAKNFGIKKEYPYMTIACFPENSLKTKMLEAVHEDGSTRIQTVREKSHPLFELLTNIEKKRKNPILINTSFNLSGEPIVENPRDAIRTFMSCGLDSLYIENYKILK